jgi:chemotaxis protein CheX
MTGQNGSSVSEDQLQAWVPLLDLAAHEVFQLMLSSELGNSAKIPPNDPSDVTSMVGLAGKLSGVMTVRCQEKAAALIASKMLGIKLEEVGDDMSDAMGEVCNMVAGNFKNKIPGLSDGCMLSPPTVITGNDYMVHAQPHAKEIERAFLFESMLLLIALHIHS